jgi:hypothetical protein
MIAAGQSAHTLNVLAMWATGLAAASALLTVITIVFARHVLKHEKHHHSAQRWPEVMSGLGKRGLELAHRDRKSA